MTAHLAPGRAGGLDLLRPAIPGIAFTTRDGGVSSPPYDSLNLSFAGGDRREAVTENRRRVAEALGISPRWVTGRQVHGSRVLVAGVEDLDRREECDALLTATPDLPLAILGADCAPVALAALSPGTGLRVEAVGAVHAGHGGIVSGVVQAAVAEIRRMAGTECRAVLGPSIGPCHYPVGAEVPARFKRAFPAAPDFTTRVAGSLRFDLRAAVRWQLRTAGAEVKEDDPPCTSCDPRFFSHRRDGPTGRHGLIVWIHRQRS